MIATVITLVTSVFEILDQLFGTEFGLNVPAVEIFLAAITPLLVWLVPNVAWRAFNSRWPH